MIVVYIPLFYTINEVSIVLDLTRLDNSGGIGETLSKYEGQYHQSRRLMFNNNDKVLRTLTSSPLQCGMVTLKEKHPYLFGEFRRENLVLHKSN